MTYRYLVLGATHVLRPDGSGVPLSGSRLRALLVALAASAGRPVTPGELVAQVWAEGDRPADEAAALQALVGRLRRALGREAVESAPGGYRLAAGPEDIDLFRFERLASEGAAALDAGEPAAAAAVLDEALALWRGPALADLPGRHLDPSAVRAERRRSQAHRHRLAVEVALGRAEQVLAEIAALTADAPLDEPLHALLIRALQAAGRNAEALQAYEEARARLADRLGADPGAELRALHAQLLTGEDAAPHAGRADRTGRGSGGGTIPARLTSFVGREEELAALAVELRRSRLVTLLGPGGAGKTRLAFEAAAAAGAPGAHGDVPDGVWVAGLAPVREEATVPEAVLTALGARTTQVRGPADTPVRDPLAQLVEHCARRRMLLVLDNCEHVVDAAARLAEALLTRCPGVRVLATSREPLGVPGETLRGVGPLPQDVALRLLGDRGAAARPGFTVADDPVACAEICGRLDGLPLALELAAARLRSLTPRQIADRLDDRFRLLTGGSRTLLPRQQTLRAVVDWSWDLLDESERAVLRRLSVFSGGCTLERAEAVCGADALDSLTSLVDKSLVIAVPGGPDGMRYGLLETVAEYARQRLAEAGERERVELLHMRVHRELARTGDPGLRGPGQTAWLDRFEAELDNVRAALTTAVRHKEEQEALCLVLSMNWFWQQRGHQADARVWSPAVAGLGPDPFAEPVRPAVPLPDPVTAAPPPWPEEVVWEARRGVRLMALASTEDDGTGLSEPGTQAFLRAVVAAYRPGLPQLRRQPASMWFFARLMTGGFAGLAETLDAVVDEFGGDDGADRGGAGRDGGDDGWELAFTLLMRARLPGARRGGPGHALRDAGRALALFEAVGDHWGIAESLSARGEALEGAGMHREAAADFERAMESSARVEADAQVPVFKARLASARLKTAGTAAEREQAERQLVEAVRESGRFAAAEVVSTARVLLVQHYGRTGRLALARSELRLIEAELTEAGPALFSAALVGTHGWLDCLEGDFAGARSRAEQAVRRLEWFAIMVAPHLISDQFLCAAWAAAHVGEAVDGARLLGAYDAGDRVAGGLGFRPFADESEVRGRAESDLRGVLGEQAYESAYAEGGSLSLREATALISGSAPGAG
ncbi:BTAD domain-containing putative transcriptional regulator [Streptomyces sp. NPDC048389]|uniref:BTAD domain-containing putative transcriptional regulator n=1 Tax=Streptomyces sp. NPDC048389 TaxID=3154622 RepID=UPI0034557C60